MTTRARLGSRKQRRDWQGVIAVIGTVACVIAIVSLSSCAGYTSAKAAQPGNGGGTLAASPASLNFGNVTTGGSQTLALNISNTGTGTVNILSGAVSGAGFSLAGSSLSSALPKGQSVAVSIQFAPQSPGAASGSFSIVSDASDSQFSISLSGSGVSPGLSSSPASAAFGKVRVGEANSVVVTLSNSGTAAVNISSAAASGGGFSISGLSTPLKLNPGDNSSFTAKFAPPGAGEAVGSISLSNDSPNSPFIVPLTGEGTQAAISVSPSSVSFEGVPVGSKNSQTITVTNRGSASLTISQVSVSGAGFSTAGIAPPVTVANGGSTSFTIVFDPNSPGAATGSVSISSNAPGAAATIALSGTGTQAGISANPSSVAFGSVSTGNRNSQTISLTNTGSATLTISQASVSGRGFSISGLAIPATIGSGKNLTFNASFAPTSAGTVTGSISITSNTPNSPLSIPLSGTGVASTALLSVSPGSLSFGTVNVGSTGSSQVTLTNTGNSNVTISSVSVSGSGFADAGISATVLTPSQSATLNVTFAPSAPGSVSGNLSIASNATNSPANVALSGTAVQNAQHSAALTWNPSTSQDVVGYNVYRSTTSGSNFAKITSSPTAQLQFTDTAVQSGQTYFYVVTAVNTSNAESVPSIQVSAQIP